jgi:hypothetical protein
MLINLAKVDRISVVPDREHDVTDGENFWSSCCRDCIHCELGDFDGEIFEHSGAKHQVARPGARESMETADQEPQSGP